MTFLQSYITLHLKHFATCPVGGNKSPTVLSKTDECEMFYYTGCCTFCGSLENKCQVSGAIIFIVPENNVLSTLKLTINVTNSVNLNKCEIMHLLKQPCHFSLFLQVFKLFYLLLVIQGLCKCNAVPGGLLSMFTTSENLVMRCKLQNVLVYKSCTMAKVF